MDEKWWRVCYVGGMEVRSGELNKVLSFSSKRLGSIFPPSRRGVDTDEDIIDGAARCNGDDVEEAEQSCEIQAF